MSTKIRLTRQTWEDFQQMYFHERKFPHQRLGQAAVNHFGFVNEGNLFLEEDSTRAYNYIASLLKDYQL